MRHLTKLQVCSTVLQTQYFPNACVHMHVVTSSIVDFYTFLAFEREINEQSHMS